MRFPRQDRNTASREIRARPLHVAARAPFTGRLVHSGGRPVLVVSGEIDRSNIEQFAAALEDAVTAGSPLIVDMEQVTFMGADGVRVLVQTLDRLDRRPDAMVLRSPSRIIRWVLRASRVDNLVTIVDQLDSANDTRDC